MNGGGHRAVWRLHFYAGLFCVPFILWLAVTGSIYLFKPQIEGWIDRPYDGLAMGAPMASAADQVRAALKAVPGAAFARYELPQAPTQAVRVIVDREGEAIRVYVHPQTLAVLKTVREEDRLMRTVFRLHGELMMGERGSWLVELAASWAIVMIATGLYLWWPREARGLGGIVYPRLRAGGRTFWRDLHAVTGLWISTLALFLLVTGLPWAAGWGAYLKEVRALTGTAVAKQDWPGGGGEHAEHGHKGAAGTVEGIDLVAAAAAQLDLAPPVMLQPPGHAGGAWTVKSDAQNRPLRATATIDPASGRILGREDFADRHPIDRAVGYGIAAHEGQLFGWLNQALGVVTALGLIAVSISAYAMWWRRRPKGGIGAPARLAGDRLPRIWVATLAVLGLLLPLLGATLLLVLGGDRLVARLRR